MIEELGRVLSVEPGAVWVETVRQSACGNCQARAGCGQALLHKLSAGSRQGFIRVLSEHRHQVGDQVVIGIPEDAVVLGSVWLYMVPLLALFLFAMLAQSLGLSEPAIVAGASLGLAAGLALVRWHGRRHSGDPRFQPHVLRTAQHSLVAAPGG